MTRKLPIGLALIALTWARPVPAGDDPRPVRDHARLFSPEAVRRADDALEAFRRDHGWQVIIETVESLGGRDVKEHAVADARAAQVRGLFVLIARDEHKVWAQPSRSAEQAFPRTRTEAISGAFIAAFKRKQYDQGLDDAVAAVRGAATPSPLPAAPSAGAVAAKPDPVSPKSTKPSPDVSSSPTAPAGRSEPASEPPPAMGLDRNMVPIIAAVALGGLLLIWLVSMAFRRPQSPANFGGPPADRTQPTGPPAWAGPGATPGPAAGIPPGYAPAVPPGYAPAVPPGYATGARPGSPIGGPAGYGPGYAPAPPAAGGYGPPPPQQGGGNFLGSLAGGIGGAVIGNVLYDQFGRPHHEGHPAPPGAALPPGGHASDVGAIPPPTQAGGWGPDEPPPTPESYNPAAGSGGDWSAPEPEASPPGDWGNTEPQADWGGPAEAPPDDLGAGGDWGDSAAEDRVERGDGGGTESLGGGEITGTETGAGGDWGGAAEGPAQEGDW